MTYLGKFCIESISFMFMSSSTDEFMLSKQNLILFAAMLVPIGIDDFRVGTPNWDSTIASTRAQPLLH